MLDWFTISFYMLNKKKKSTTKKYIFHHIKEAGAVGDELAGGGEQTHSRLPLPYPAPPNSPPTRNAHYNQSTDSWQAVRMVSRTPFCQ